MDGKLMTGSESTPKVSVIIVNYNSGVLLAKCIDSLKRQTFKDWEAIIIDNCSCDDSLDFADGDDLRIRIVRLDSNLGFAAANNRGFELARGSWIATLNPDAFPEPQWLEKLLDAAARYPDVRFFGSTQLNAANPGLLDGAGDCYHAFGIPWRGGFGYPVPTPFPEGEVFGPCAAAAMYSAEILKTVGGFDESFFCYCEDVDLAFRLRLRGERCVQVADAVVHHQGSAITGVDSPFSLYHSSRNRLWTAFKNMPGPLLIILLPAHLAATFYLLFRFRKTERFKPQWDGLMAGFRDWRRIVRERRKVQASRCVTSLRIAAAFTWSMEALRQRCPDVRAIKYSSKHPCSDGGSSIR
jgi:N-acetylglucosaminyl-diphospho-decaprenol L-rhamnosyltransferase